MVVPVADVRAGDPVVPQLASSGRRWWTLAGLSLASFLLTLGDTALAVALPSIGRELRLGMSGLEWVVNAYTLALAVFLLAGGWLTDRLGGRRVFLFGTVLFIGASLVAGLAQSDWLLLAGRTLQGIAGALVLPATLALVTVSFPAGGRGLALGVWAGAGAAALALGPLVGAVVTEQLGWAWIFLLNVPLGILALVAACLALPEARERTAGRIDLAGLAASAIAVFAVGFALTEVGRYGWASPVVLGGLAAGAVAFAAFVRVELTQTAPLVDLRRFTTRRVAGANVVTLLSTAVMCSVLFFVSLYLQTARGYSPLGTGAAFLPMTALILVVAPCAGRLSDRVGSRTPATAGMLSIALGLLMLSEFGLGDGLRGLVSSLAVVGFGVGLVTTPVTAAALADVAEHEAGVAAGVLNTSRMVGLTLGIALMGAIVAARWPGGFAIATAQPGVFADGLALAFRINAGIALATAALAAATLAGSTRPPAAFGALRRGQPPGEFATAPVDP